jgi:hypothetical protein
VHVHAEHRPRDGISVRQAGYIVRKSGSWATLATSPSI